MTLTKSMVQDDDKLDDSKRNIVQDDDQFDDFNGTLFTMMTKEMACSVALLIKCQEF